MFEVKTSWDKELQEWRESCRSGATLPGHARKFRMCVRLLLNQAMGGNPSRVRGSLFAFPISLSLVRRFTQTLTHTPCKNPMTNHTNQLDHGGTRCRPRRGGQAVEEGPLRVGHTQLGGRVGWRADEMADRREGAGKVSTELRGCVSGVPSYELSVFRRTLRSGIHLQR